MPILVPGRPLSSRDAAIRVENRLDPGTYRFRLTLLDEAGHESAPAEITLRVDRVAPVAAPAGGITDLLRRLMRPDAPVGGPR